MAKQEMNRLQGELQILEERITAKEQKLLELTEAQASPAVITLLKEQCDRLVTEKKDLRQQLNTLQTQPGGVQHLNYNQVLEYLERDYGAAFRERIQSPSSELCQREGPITPDKDGLLYDVGDYLQLQGYEDLGQNALHGLLVLQSRSLKVQQGSVHSKDEKFESGTHFIREVSAPGTGKTTALHNIWGYVHENFQKLVALLPIQPDDSSLLQLHERIKNCLSSKCFLSFTFSNQGLPELEPLEKTVTSDFMATRMLFAMVGARRSAYSIFLENMDPSLRLALTSNLIMDFIHQNAGLGDRPGLVVFNFDECGTPRVNPATGTTYFQDGLSRLVSLRWIEAQKRFEASNRARDILPVVVIAGSHSAHMNLLRTGSGRARLFTLGRPLLDDESLLETAMDFLLRVAAGSGRELPETAGAVLKLAIPWLGFNPRHLVFLLQNISSDPHNPSVALQPPLHVGRLREFLSLHKSALEDKIFAVLGKVEENIRSSNWKEWLSGAEDKRKAALFMHSFAHTITARPIARCAKIPDTGITWGDAENDGFVSLTDGQKVDLRQGQPSYPQQRSDLSDKDMEVGAFMDAGDNAPDTSPTAYVHIPPLLLHVMYQQLAVTWTRVRSLQQFTESWIDREQSDLGLLLLRLQLVHLVFKEEVLDLEQLCPGLSFLGEVQVPKNGYDIQRMDQQLNAASFQRQCLQHASRDSCWAYLGPGNWGPDAWLILFNLGGDPVVIYVQSKMRSTITAMYPQGAPPAEALKCWSISNVKSCLLFLTDERGRGHDNEALDVEGGMPVVPVSRDARATTFGIAMATLKRCRETITAKDAGRKKPKKKGV